MKRIIYLLSLIVLAIASLCVNWKTKGNLGTFPDHPINVIVHSSPGGGTDIWVRKFSALMEKEMGVKMIVSNRPGGKGGVAANVVWNSPHDGYTILGGSETSMIYYVNGACDKTVKDWDFLLCGGSPGVIAVLADSKINSFDKFLQNNLNDGPIRISNAGKGKLWHLKAVLLEQFCDAPIIHSPYNGSNPAIVALLSGEVDAITCSAGEIAAYVESGKVKPLVMMENFPFQFENFGTVQPVTNYFPEIDKYMPMNQVLCFLIPDDIPERVKQIIHHAFLETMKSDQIKKFIQEQYASKIGLCGTEARELVIQMESKLSWFIYDNEISSISPLNGGIQKL